MARRIVAAGCFLVLIGAVGGAGELPEAVGPVALGAPTPPGTWMEYRLSLPVDPLETLLADQAAQAAADADTARTDAGRIGSEPETSKTSEPKAGAGSAAEAAKTEKAVSGASGAAAVAVPMTPAYELPARWARYPVRLTVRAASPLTLEVEVRTPGAAPTTATLARAGPLAADIREAMAAWAETREENGPSATDIEAGVAAAPVAGPVGGMGAAEPDEVGRATWALFNREISVSTARYGTGAGAVEIWTAPEVPLGVAWLRTRDMELSLWGYGAGDAPAFPLPEAVAPDREE